jgi:hypothetical protein
MLGSKLCGIDFGWSNPAKNEQPLLSYLGVRVSALSIVSPQFLPNFGGLSISQHLHSTTDHNDACGQAQIGNDVKTQTVSMPLPFLKSSTSRLNTVIVATSAHKSIKITVA